jgi:hypothetical protein
LWDNFDRATRKALNAYRRGTNNNQGALNCLVAALNKVLSGGCVYEEQRFAPVPLAEHTRKLATKKAQGDDLIRLNRMLLEEAFPRLISWNRQIKRLDWLVMHADIVRPVRIRPMRNVKQQILDKIRMDQNPAWVVDHALKDSDYVLTIDFGQAGIAAALKAWLAKEAKAFPGAPRAKAAVPPYDCLKWLAAYRLEAARIKAGASFEDIKTALAGHVKSCRRDILFGATLPTYASPGAWSKAKGDAKRLLDLLESDPRAFEKKILF